MKNAPGAKASGVLYLGVAPVAGGFSENEARGIPRGVGYRGCWTPGRGKVGQTVVRGQRGFVKFSRAFRMRRRAAGKTLDKRGKSCYNEGK